MDSYEDFITQTAENIRQSGLAADAATTLYLKAHVAASEHKEEPGMIFGRTIEKARADLENILRPVVTVDQIRQIMEAYGKSFSYLGATYSKEFVEWFKLKKPGIYEYWLEANKEENYEEIPEENYAQFMFLHCFSSEAAGDTADDQEHDALLAEFCAVNSAAAMHINKLYNDLSKG